MTAEKLKERTKAYALRVVRLVQSLPKERVAGTMGNQLLRAATSVGANYRAACRARSSREFVAKLGVVEEECDESVYWLELLEEAGVMPPKKLASLKTEGNELTSIFVASINTARKAKK